VWRRKIQKVKNKRGVRRKINEEKRGTKLTKERK